MSHSDQGLAPDATVVVVGASLAGLRAAETLRREGHRGPLVMVGAEEDFNYDRPPLSKQFLAGTWGLDRIRLRPPDKIDALGLDLRLGRRAAALDVDGRRVHLDDGATLEYDGLVIATGAHPRTLPGTEASTAARTLRTLADATALAGILDAAQAGLRDAAQAGASDAARAGVRDAAHAGVLDAAQAGASDAAQAGASDAARAGALHVVVVGGGFIGAEVAATCAGRGARVTLVEALPTPLGRVLGEAVGSVCVALHEDHGVEVLTATGVDAVTATPDGAASVRLGSGSVLDADVVVVGIGVVPGTEWLERSALHIDNGVVTDAALFAADRVVAAGDVCRWAEPRLDGEHVRLEHWTNAAEQGVHAAHSLLAGRRHAQPFDTVPYFWSDQYDVKIQMLGHPRPDDDIVVVEGTGSLDDGRFVALYGRAGRLAAVLGFGRPRQLMGYRPLLVAGASFDQALAHRS